MGRRLRTYGVVGNVVCKLCSWDWFTCGYFTLAGASGCVCVGVLGEGAVWGGAGEGCRDHAKKQPGQANSCDVISAYLPLELNTECCISKDSKGFPKNITNNRGKKRYPDSKDLTVLLKTCDTSFLDFLRRCLV